MEREKLIAMLRKDGIKLWLPPYSKEDFTKGDFPQDLKARYATEVGWSVDLISETIEALRLRTVDRCLANDKYRDQGMATVYIRKTANPDEETTPVEIQLSDQSEVLREKVRQRLSLRMDQQIKMIGCGKILDDGRSLDGQGVTHNTEILIIEQNPGGLSPVASPSGPSQSKSSEQEDWMESISKTRAAAEELAYTEDSKEAVNQLNITDQHGNLINLPDIEQRALTIAMALQEKGRAALKSGNHGRAVIYFLESDKEYKKCSSSLLEATDNYPILCMDIVWCYLHLRSVTNLPDAQDRLKTAEVGFNKAYGHNLERVAKLKNSVELERCLLIRLKLLSGILAYYSRDLSRAESILNELNSELKHFIIDDNKLAQVMAMGYSNQDSRLALRATRGDVTAAVAFIIERKEDEKRQKNTTDAQKKRRSLGKTKNGTAVDENLYQNLIDMGFSETDVKSSLQESNNNMDDALELLRLKREYHGASTVFDENLCRTLVEMGFAEADARSSLQESHNNMDAAIELLRVKQENPAAQETSSEPSSGSGSSTETQDSDGGGRKNFSDEVLAQLVGMGFSEEAIARAFTDSAGAYQTALNLLSSGQIDNILKEEAAKMSAYEELKDDIGGDLDHLDINFMEETQLLAEFMDLIHIQKQSQSR